MSPIIKYLHKLVGYIGHLDRIINGKCIRTVQTDVYLPEKKKNVANAYLITTKT